MTLTSSGLRKLTVLFAISVTTSRISYIDISLVVTVMMTMQMVTCECATGLGVGLAHVCVYGIDRSIDGDPCLALAFAACCAHKHFVRCAELSALHSLLPNLTCFTLRL